jgi:hypothetical protein
MGLVEAEYCLFKCYVVFEPFIVNATVGRELIQRGEMQALRKPLDLLTSAVA